MALKITVEQAAALKYAESKSPTALSMFRPTEPQEEFFLKMEREDVIEVLLGGGNRSGKSCAASICMASIILDQPVIFRDGSEHRMRPEKWRGDALKVWMVGYDWKHTGKTLFRLLFKKGLFKTIRDAGTGKWRCWNPTNPGEDKLFSQTKPSPPLIKFSYLVGGEEGISWENKKENQISACDFVHDGSRVEFFASTGAIPQGDPVNVIWIDEKIDDGRLYNELKVRTIDYQGRLLWTAWPDTAPSDEMAALNDRAADQEGKSDQTSFAVKLRGADNIYTKSVHRDKIFAAMNEDEREARDEGVLNNDRWRVYPRFNKYIHRAYGPDRTKDDKLAATLRKGVPANWTRYLILDPGTANPAILFVAVPPPEEFGDYVVPYDELYLHYTSAKPLAEAAAAKAGIRADHPGDVFEEFIADFHACRQTPAGFDGTIGQNYETEFAKVKLRSRRHGAKFTPGSDQVRVRIMRVQAMLHPRLDASVRLRILGCPQLVKQLENCKWGSDPKGNPTNDPSKYQHIDVVQCLEYLASRDDCGYFKPPPIVLSDGKSPSEVMKKFELFFGKSPQRPDNSILCGAIS